MPQRWRKGAAMLGGVIVWLIALFDEQGRSAITRLGKWMIDPPIRLGLIAIGTSLIIYAFWDQLLHLFGVQSKKRLEANIRAWLDTYGFSIKRLPNDKAHFEFRVTPENGASFIVGNYHDNEHYLFVSGGARFSDEDRPVYFSLPEDVQGLIGSKAIMELCRSSVSYSVDLSKDKAQIFKRVPITADLNEHVLMTSIDELENARSLFARSLGHAMLEVRKRLELSPPKQEQKTEGQRPPDVLELPQS